MFLNPMPRNVIAHIDQNGAIRRLRQGRPSTAGRDRLDRMNTGVSALPNSGNGFTRLVKDEIVFAEARCGPLTVPPVRMMPVVFPF